MVFSRLMNSLATSRCHVPLSTLDVFFAVLIGLFCMSMPAERGHAEATLAILHSFGDGSVKNDGAAPYAGLAHGTDGNFYGTTLFGGSATDGTVFKITPTGVVTILHSFGDGSIKNDGIWPLAGLIEGTDGNLYGTTSQGGSTLGSGGYDNDGYGTVFKITLSGTVTILHSFGDGSVANDGENPRASLVQGIDGSYYGTTIDGGLAGNGALFKITPSGSETILHSFSDGSVANDGAVPYGLVRGTDGDFYGVTSSGGSVKHGTVYKVTASGMITVLHSFGDGSVINDGIRPKAGLILGTNGNFYGTTYGGGSAADGTVFKITPSGVETIMHDFGEGGDTDDGEDPQASLTQGTDGDFYGTTDEGGSATEGTPDGFGTVFKITPSGVETILHAFCEDSDINDGQNPSASLAEGTDGNFYGTTSLGGTADDGTVFEVAGPTPAAPADLTARAGNEQVTLAWGADVTATSYDVYRGTSAGDESTAVATEVPSTTFVNTGLTNGKKYYFVVKAVNAAGTSGDSNESSATPTLTVPAPPTGLTSKAENEQVTLAWDASVSATSYNVYRGTASGGESTTVASGISSTMFVNTGLSNGKTYYYVVKAANSVGTSTKSNEASATPLLAIPLPPTNLTATGSSGQIALTWDASVSATSYNVYRGTTSDGESGTPIAAHITVTRYTNAGLTNIKTYYYLVKAVNAMGPSKASNQALATP